MSRKEHFRDGVEQSILTQPQEALAKSNQPMAAIESSSGQHNQCDCMSCKTALPELILTENGSEYVQNKEGLLEGNVLHALLNGLSRLMPEDSDLPEDLNKPA